MQVIKRDGRKVDFDKQKIINAIRGAFREQYDYESDDMWECTDKIANEIETMAKGRDLKGSLV